MLVLSPREFIKVEKESTALLLQVGIFPVDSDESISLYLLMILVKLMLGAIGVKSELVLERASAPFLLSRAVYSVCIK